MGVADLIKKFEKISTEDEKSETPVIAGETSPVKNEDRKTASETTTSAVGAIESSGTAEPSGKDAQDHEEESEGTKTPAGDESAVAEGEISEAKVDESVEKPSEQEQTTEQSPQGEDAVLVDEKKEVEAEAEGSEESDPETKDAQETSDKTTENTQGESESSKKKKKKNKKKKKKNSSGGATEEVENLTVVDENSLRQDSIA